MTFTFMEAVSLLAAKDYTTMKRADWKIKSPLYFDWADCLVEEGNPHEGAMLTREDLMATDWEVE